MGIDMNSLLTERIATSIVNTFKSAMGTIHEESTGKSPSFLVCVNDIDITDDVEFRAAEFLSRFAKSQYKSINSGMQIRFNATVNASVEAYYAVQTIANGVIVMTWVNGVVKSRIFLSGEVHRKVFNIGSKLNKLFKGIPVKDFSICSTYGGYVLRLLYWDGAAWQLFERSVSESN